jgi:pimeloyl-ACP methyl ester carboxylesterase
VAGLFVSTHDPGGDVPSVVLVHGSLDRSSAFARVQRHLEDVRVVRYDRRGYARSLHVGAAPCFAAQVDDLEAVVGERPAVLVGHSFGGVIALALAQRRAHLVRAVVAYESPMPWMPWWPGSTAGSAAMTANGSAEDAADRFMRRMIGDERWERVPRRTKDQWRAEGPALVADMRSIRDPHNPPYEPEQVQVPVLAAHGTTSSAHHQRTAEALAEMVPAATLTVVEGAGHAAHLTHPAELAGLARQALARAGSSRA